MIWKVNSNHIHGRNSGQVTVALKVNQIVSFESEPVKQFVQKLSLQIEEMEQLSSNAKVNFDTI